MGKVRVLRFAVAVIALTALGGCARSAPITYYILRSLPGPAPAAKTSTPGLCTVVAVGPVTIPAYLDRPQMVTRTSPETLQFAEFDRWAEPLDKNLSRILADDLSALTSGSHVCVFPWPRSVAVQYQITLNVVQMEKIPGDKVILDASWRVFENNGKKLLVMKRSSLTEPVEANAGFSAIASAQSRAVEALSREIAAVLASLPVTAGK
ncbi:MAG: PqiC family protein [Syntrophobacteraceae bacterium]|nr:PqiC family protein [Syntrophobacteraceae bacterium]